MENTVYEVRLVKGCPVENSSGEPNGCVICTCSMVESACKIADLLKDEASDRGADIAVCIRTTTVTTMVL